MANDRIDEAIAELGAAIAQTIPSDDQIIMDRVRKAYALLLEERSARREPADRGGKVEL